MGLTVKTVEHLEGDYGLYTWPCAPVLAQYVYAHRHQLVGRNVIELGAGTAVPGMVAAMCGANVTLTDREGNPRLQDNLRRTCEINHVPVGASSCQEKGRGGVSRIMALSWGVFSPELLALPSQDIVLASDCFYDSKGISSPTWWNLNNPTLKCDMPVDFEDILSTVSYFMGKNPSTPFWTTYQERSSDRSLLLLLERWDMSCQSVSLGFYPGEEGEQVEVEGLSERISSSTHTIHMWEITKKQNIV